MTPFTHLLGRRRQLLQWQQQNIIHFAKFHTPAAEGFGLITIYESNYFCVPDPINRHADSLNQQRRVRRSFMCKRNLRAPTKGQLAPNTPQKVRADVIKHLELESKENRMKNHY